MKYWWVTFKNTRYKYDEKRYHVTCTEDIIVKICIYYI